MAYFLRKIDIEKKFKELLKSLGDYGKQVEELEELSGSDFGGVSLPQFDKMMELNAAFDDYDRRFHTLLEPKKRAQSLQ